MTQNRTLSVSGMACGGCEEAVEDELGALEGVQHVEADHEAASVELTLEGELTDEELETAVQAAGYTVGESS